METFSPHLNGYLDVGSEVARHLRDRARDAFERQAHEKASLRDVGAFEARRDRIRTSMLTALGGLPDMQDTVAAEARGTIDGGAFRIEKLILETLPGVFATANLYLPHASDRSAPRPAVLFLCGHARDAKAYPEYQRVCRSLAIAGAIVLALDPIGQGERLQYVDGATGVQRVSWGTVEHSHAGFQCTVAGANIARYFVADAMQAITYLRSRPDVDPDRIGVTGNSGGGTQTSYLMLLDDRCACAAPFTFVTSRAHYLDTGQPHDAEQNLFGAIAHGPDHDDLAAGIAPKPVMIGAVASDFFGVEGTLESFARLRSVYELYGHPDRAYLAIAPGGHAYAPALREQATRFFRRHLLDEDVDLPPGLSSFAGADEAPIPTTHRLTVDDPDVLPVETLAVTPDASIMTARPDGKRVFDLNRTWWTDHARTTSPHPRQPSEGRRRLEATVVAHRPRSPMWVRTLERKAVDGLDVRTCFTFTEPGISVPMIEIRGPRTADDAPITVVLTDEGTRALERSEPWIRGLTARHERLLLFDPRATGAVAPHAINPWPLAERFGTLFRLNYDAVQLGDSLFAMQTFDALRVLEYAHRLSTDVRVHGTGMAGTLLLCAAFLDGGVGAGTFSGILERWTSILDEPFHDVPHTFEAFGLATLPDARTISEWCPGLTVVDAVDARGEPVEGRDA